MILYDRILQAMQKDDDSPEHISNKLKYYYEQANFSERQAIDNFMTALTGWRFLTFLDREEK